MEREHSCIVSLWQPFLVPFFFVRMHIRVQVHEHVFIPVCSVETEKVSTALCKNHPSFRKSLTDLELAKQPRLVNQQAQGSLLLFPPPGLGWQGCHHVQLFLMVPGLGLGSWCS